MKLRWGILSCGKISSDFVHALALLPTTEHEVVAVATRNDETRAGEFAAARGLKGAAAYGNYAQIFADANVDIVYVGSLNHQHCEAVTGALNAGKHVLCEKPLGVNVKEVQAMVDLARSKKLFLMEGFWTRFFPAMKELKTRMESGDIGRARALHVSFGIPFEDDHRTNDDASGGGGPAYDIGLYTVQLALHLFGRENLLRAQYHGLMHDRKKVEALGVATLSFTEGRTAFLTWSSLALLPNTAVLTGDKIVDGEAVQIKVGKRFWCPERLEMSGTGTVLDFPLPGSEEGYNYHNSSGFSYEAACVRHCIMQGQVECPTMPHDESLAIARILQDFRQALGVVFPQDT